MGRRRGDGDARSREAGDIRGLEESAPARPRSVTLELLGGFRLVVDGLAVHLPLAECRVLVAVALHDRRQLRSALAGRLWPDTTTDLALARLRTALWRLRRACLPLLEVEGGEVGLSSEVVVDVRELIVLSRLLIDDPSPTIEARVEQLGETGELLPDWDDEWLIADRERVHQIRLRALEVLSERLTNDGRYGLAVEVALAVIADDPLRESARRAVIRAYVAEGNVHEALVQYGDYRVAMRIDLGLEPSDQMEALIRDVRLACARPGAGAGRRPRA